MKRNKRRLLLRKGGTMNIDAIRECIRLSCHTVTVGRRVELHDNALAELTALEADNAVKDGALRSIIEPDGSKEDMKTWCAEDAVLLDIPAEEVIQQLCEEMGRVRTEAQAALSLPTGKVLVEREKLLKIHALLNAWVGLGEQPDLGDIAMAIEHLAALLKD